MRQEVNKAMKWTEAIQMARQGQNPAARGWHMAQSSAQHHRFNIHWSFHINRAGLATRMATTTTTKTEWKSQLKSTLIRDEVPHVDTHAKTSQMCVKDPVIL